MKNSNNAHTSERMNAERERKADKILARERNIPRLWQRLLHSAEIITSNNKNLSTVAHLPSFNALLPPRLSSPFILSLSLSRAVISAVILRLVRSVSLTSRIAADCCNRALTACKWRGISCSQVQSALAT